MIVNINELQCMLGRASTLLCVCTNIPACTKRRNVETKRPKRNGRNHRNDRNETTETKRPKRNDRNETAENINYRKNGKH